MNLAAFNLFLGVMSLIALIVFECLIMAARAKDMAGKLLCVGLAGQLAFQSFSNIAVATGIFPNTGLPLPGERLFQTSWLGY